MPAVPAVPPRRGGPTLASPHGSARRAWPGSALTNPFSQTPSGVPRGIRLEQHGACRPERRSSSFLELRHPATCQTCSLRTALSRLGQLARQHCAECKMPVWRLASCKLASLANTSGKPAGLGLISAIDAHTPLPRGTKAAAPRAPET